jgi:hypothetical protein
MGTNTIKRTVKTEMVPKNLCFDPENFDNDDGDTSVGRLNPNPIPVVSQNVHTVADDGTERSD